MSRRAKFLSRACMAAAMSAAFVCAPNIFASPAHNEQGNSALFSLAPFAYGEENSSAHSDQEKKTSPYVRITSLGNPLLKQGENIHVEADIFNPTKEDISIESVSLHGQPSTPLGRDFLIGFMHGEGVTPPLMKTLSDPLTVPATSHSHVVFDVERSSLLWSARSADWGARGIEVRAVTAEGATLTDRNFLVIAPNYEVKKSPTGVVIPLTPSTEEREQLTDSAIKQTKNYMTSTQEPSQSRSETKSQNDSEASSSAQTQSNKDKTESSGESDKAADDESLSQEKLCKRICQAVRKLSVPGATLMLDPISISENSSGTHVYVPVDDASRAVEKTGSGLLSTLEYDADAQALAHAGRSDILGSLFSQTNSLIATTGINISSNTAVLDSHADAQTIPALTTAGIGSVIIPGNLVKPTEENTYTPTARFNVSAGGAYVAALASDPYMSSVISGVLPSVAGAEKQGTIQLNALQSRQLLLALSATTYRERPGIQRASVITTDRASLPEWGASDTAAAKSDSPLSPAVLSESISALMSAPWVAPTSVGDLLAQPAGEEKREDLPEKVDIEGALSAQELKDMSAREQTIDKIARVTPLNSQITQSAQSVTFALTSRVWRDNPQARSEDIADLAKIADSYSKVLSITPSSTVNIISQSTQLPLRLANSLPVDAGVVVHVESADPRLKIKEDVPITIPAKSDITINVPVDAQGSGNIFVKASLLDPHGEILSAERTIHVRVRADWENNGTIAVGVFLVGVIVFGVWRSVNRQLRSRKKNMRASRSHFSRHRRNLRRRS